MPRVNKLLILAIVLLVILTIITSSVSANKTPVTLQILTVSDWHAQLDPVNGVGGAAVLSTYFQNERATNPNTLTLTAGDAYGAAPPLSSFFNEEPAVQAMNLMGFDTDTFGNHNFDKGTDHLQQMIELADFPYVSANLLNREDNLTGVSDYQIFDVGGVSVAVIGLTNPEAPTLVFPGSFGTIEVTDPVEAANRARAAAKREGAQVFIVITHMGVTGFDSATGAPFGPVVDFANEVRGFHLIVADHTDIQYNGIINKQLVVENRSKGVTYARILLTVDANNGHLISRSATFLTPTASAVTPDQAIVDMLQPYRDALAPILGTVIGSSTRVIPRADACGQSAGRTCESLLGNVTTDAMRLRYEVDFAITNSGGLRADLTCPVTDNPADFCPAYTPSPYPISRGQVLTVLPFGNVVATLSLDGAELKAMLENGVSAMPGVNGRFPQISGLCFTYDISAAIGSRVTSAVRQADDGSCTGTAVDLTTASTYTLATNDFMANGGDGYPVLISRATTRDVMDQVLADHITANSPVAPSIQGRINCTTSGATVCPVVTP